MSWWRSMIDSYWFYPALFALGSFLLALATTWADRNALNSQLELIPFWEPARPTGASNMLSVIASSMIGVASTVFSITIAAVVYASGNYGPRLLTNFMENVGNKLSLGVFIGTFVYALTVLRVVRSASEDRSAIDGQVVEGFTPQLSLMVSYVLMGLAIMTLVFFLNHVPSSIRINTVLQSIGERLIGDIKKEYEVPAKGRLEFESPDGLPITALSAGYIQVIDYEGLNDLAMREDATIKLNQRSGDFVHQGMTLAYWSDPDEACDLPDDEVLNCFSLGGRRTPHGDMLFLMDELSEIGLRALSPGINDPFTAITALHWMGAAIAELGRRDLHWSYGDEARVVLLGDDYQLFVERGFGAMRSAASANRVAAVEMFDVIADASMTLDDESRRAILKREGDLLRDQAIEELSGPELHAVEARYQTFVNEIKR